MSLEWMISDRRRPKSSFLDDWRVSVSRVANLPPHARTDLGDVVFNKIVTTKNLHVAWDWLATYGGPAAGPNRQTFADYTRAGAWGEIERLQNELTDRSYRHGSVRKVPVPKRPGSSGRRPLSLPDIQDRVVGRGIAQILEAIFSSLWFDQRSFCRYGRGIHQALAHAKMLAEKQDRWIWIAEDLRGAFDVVPLDQLFAICERYLPSARLNDLIRRSVDDQREMGLFQGAPLSPLLMNLYLHELIDRQWRQLHPDVPLLRYMDDLLILCNDSDDVDQLYQDLAHFVGEAEMQLKHGVDIAIHDARVDDVDWLGYRLRAGGDGFEIRLPLDTSAQQMRTWRNYLVARFEQLHERANAPLAARQMIRGVIAWAGPALPWTDTRAVYDLFRKAARAAAFEEIDSYEATLACWQRSYRNWCSSCDRVETYDNRRLITLPKHSEGEVWSPDMAPWEEPAVMMIGKAQDATSTSARV